VGALPWPRRRQRYCHDQPASGAPARRRAVQHRAGGNGTAWSESALCSPNSACPSVGERQFRNPGAAVYRGLSRLEIQSELVNHEKYVRYQALFPTTIRNGRYFVEIPFGTIERPPGIEFPAQHWVDYTDGHRGVALLNFGLPGNLVTDGTLLLSLLRAHNLGAYGMGRL